MILKQFIILLFVFLLLNGCSSLNSSSHNSTPFLKTWGTGDDTSNALVEHSPTQKVETPVEFDPVMESTRLALQSSQAIVNIPTANQRDEYLEKQVKKPQFDNIWERLPSLYQFSDIDHKRIQAQQTLFLKHKKQLEQISLRASPFLFLITEEVDKRNIPGEIALLPIIESAFRSRARSRKKAAGLWQFMPATGRHFGLKQTWWYDGRRDVYKSTLAALTYLEQLNKYYKGDWMLALAAYNVGAGNVNKAVRKNHRKGKPVDYWSLDLPKETRNYVPKLLAVANLIKHSKDYEIHLSPIANSPKLMLVNTQSQIDLSIAAKMTDVSLQEVQTYNPGFNRWATDPEGPHHLLLPIDKVARFEKKLALLEAKDRVQWHRHKIRSGESLSVIAHKYKLSTKAIKKANHLNSNLIRAGKYLLVPIAPDQIAKKTTNTPVSTAALSRLSVDAQTYSVHKGDSFWKIARKFNISQKKLASLNGLSTRDTLSIGQILIIDPSSPITQRTPGTSRQVSYTVKKGDSLYVISKRFKVTINELKSWNKLNQMKYLKPGQELKVYVTVASQAI